MSNQCQICHQRMLSHARYLQCTVCQNNYHVNCTTLNLEEKSYLLKDIETWYCKLCVCSVFPYNHIENNDEFLNTIAKHLWHSGINLTHFSDKVFNPFDLNDSYPANPLDHNDPDLNFYNEIHFHCASKCTYLTESKFKEYLSSKIDNHYLPFSICHLNIRSLSKNLADFINFMECLDFKFSVFAFSETWLKDNNCDVYGI